MRRLTPLAILVLALAACGDTSTEDATTDAAVDCDANPGETVTVDIPEFAFDPTPVEVNACDSVVWENTHDQAHTSTGKGDKAWSTDNLAPGSTSEPVLFGEAGTFTYICALHPFMEGTVDVT
jgi:plastocyanin